MRTVAAAADPVLTSARRALGSILSKVASSMNGATKGWFLTANSVSRAQTGARSAGISGRGLRLRGAREAASCKYWVMCPSVIRRADPT